MSLQSRAATAGAVSAQTVPTPPASESTFEQRWGAWEARGAARDRAFRRKLTVAAPVLAVVGLVIAILFLSR